MLKSKQITEGAILTAIYTVLILIAYFVPLLGTISQFILPVPIIIYTYKHGLKPALLMAVVAILVSALFTNVFSILMGLTAMIGGIMVGLAIYQTRSAYETWARGAVGFAFGLLIALLITQAVVDVNFYQEIEQQMDVITEQSDKLIAQFDLGQEASDQVEQFGEMIDMMVNLLPLVIVLGGIIYAFISQWVGYKIINRIDQMQLRFPPFRDLTFPSAILWIYLVALLITLFEPDPEGTLFIAVQNIALLVGILMLIQGLSFIFYYAYHKNMTAALPVIVIIAGIFFAPIAFPLLRILGIIDIGFKLRERMSEDKK